jgi:MoxR-like ATPase
MTNEQLIETMESMIPTTTRKYYTTKILDIDIKDIINKSQLKGFNVKFQGPTGSGKTTHFENFCVNTKQPHFVANMKGSTTSEELIGAISPSEEKDGSTFVWKDGVVIRALKYSNLFKEVKVNKDGDEYVWEKPAPNYEIDLTSKNKINKEDIISQNGDEFIVKAWPRCMLTIEEINFSPEELMSVWFSLLDHRRNIVLNEKDGEVVKAGKFLSVNATMNPDYIGTNPLNDALNDRFLIKLDIDYDKKIENNIINERTKEFNFNIEDVKTLNSFVGFIRSASKKQQIRGNVSTRMIDAFLKIKGEFDDSIAKISLFNSFDEIDREYAMSEWERAEALPIDVLLTDKELDGLDFESFEGYKPIEKKPKVKKANKKVPF